MNEVTLRDMFESHKGRQIDKWEYYLDIYERHFARFRGTAVRVLEIGVDHGGSLQLWKRYFGPDATIMGVDNDPAAMFTEHQIDTYNFDQCNPSIYRLGLFDIVIDDGSHNRQHQETTFTNLWPYTRGVYLIEDCHNGYPSLITVSTAPIVYKYPWVIVAEKPIRKIRGTPSRELRQDELEARALYGDT